MKILSWNVNGLRASIRKGFVDFIEKEQPDVICLQETKANKSQVELDLPDYKEYWNSAERKGYAGTAIFTKEKPISIDKDLKVDEKTFNEMQDEFGNANEEGRIITAEFEDFYLTTVYTPNAKRGLERLEYRHQYWDPLFLDYVKELNKKKAVIFCGDLNVAHKPIDLARPKSNEGKHGYTKEEREGFENMLKAGFIDIYRERHPKKEIYTYWSPWAKSRERNVGWRIDYFMVAEKFKKRVKDAFILTDIMGSDHCPIGIEID